MNTTSNRPDPMSTPVTDPPKGGKGVLWTIALVLLIIGGINWGLVGLFNVDLVASIFGSMSSVSRLVYILVGLSAVISIFVLPRVARAG
jgi:uncharacterized membrane protein YuzA (DUF378 family)